MHALALSLVCAFPPSGEAGAVRTDLARFPPRPMVQAACAFGSHYRAYMDRQRWFGMVGRPEDYRLASDEAAECQAVWDALDWVHHWHLNKDPYKAREWLDRLRELIGEEDWTAGTMPPPAPFWRFREVGR